MGGLAASAYIDWRIATSMLVTFLLLSIETYLASYTLGTFRLSFAKLGPTEIRIVLAIGNVVLWLRPAARVPGISWRLFDFGGIVAAFAMSAMVVAAAVGHTRILYLQETRR
jgi:hypothetical protein